MILSVSLSVDVYFFSRPSCFCSVLSFVFLVFFVLFCFVFFRFVIVLPSLHLCHAFCSVFLFCRSNQFLQNLQNCSCKGWDCAESLLYDVSAVLLTCHTGHPPPKYSPNLVCRGILWLFSAALWVCVCALLFVCVYRICVCVFPFVYSFLPFSFSLSHNHFYLFNFIRLFKQTMQ